MEIIIKNQLIYLFAMVKVGHTYTHHHQSLASLVVNGSTNGTNGVQMGSGLKGSSTITLGDHAVTASNWEYITISVILFLILTGVIGFFVWRYNKAKESENEDKSNKK